MTDAGVGRPLTVARDLLGGERAAEAVVGARGTAVRPAAVGAGR